MPDYPICWKLMLLKSWIPKNHYPCDVETDRKGGGNFYEEQRTAKVPTTYRERYDWMSVFELLAHSMIITNIPLYVPSHYTRRNRHFFKVWEFRRRGCLRWRESRICSRKITEMAFEISWKYMRSALFFPFFA